MSVLGKSKNKLVKSKSETRIGRSGLAKSIDRKKVKVGGKVFSRLRLKRDIMREGRVLNRHTGAVEMIAERVCDEVEKWIGDRPEITEADLNRVTAARIRKYDVDLAYVYRNRGKII